MSHTPGPWRTSNYQGGVFQFDVVGPHGEDIGYANVSDGADEPTIYPADANARLMAAAPDLLAACRIALEGLPEIRHEAKRVLISAIAKAEGK